ncbi:threonine/serine exporter family protein [Paraliomyxa miuraensis]|uniref:threonine/serine ThrE exporter family protein n=1 Tax=Paraliomyxa miuraensis TaxID=376150 RepID=UPI00225BF13A|nr:threonine/serine exporter family protein [Paraliomyxa miuraensis]MCX4246260.1 threonine/serine exporter family protein [Paraliomyxa miuraensis]
MNEDPTRSAPALVPGPPPAARLLLRLAKALHEHGTPAHRLEQSLARLAEALELPSAQFLSTPTAMHVSFGEGPEQRVHLLRAPAERVDLDALSELDAIVDALVARRIDASTAEARLTTLSERPAPGSPRASRWASAAASASAAVFLGGGVLELGLAALLGAGVTALAQRLAGHPRAQGVHAPLAALLVSFLVSTAAAMLPGLVDAVVLISALIMLVPGLSLTVAMTELASGHVVSGTSRLAGAMTLMLTMLFGAALGRALASGAWVPGSWPTPTLPLPPGTWLAAIAASTLAFTVLLGARARDVGWIALICLLSYGAATMGGRALGAELGAFVAATAVGMASNAFARRLKRPATVLRLPGLLLLVPGSLGFRSLGSLLVADTVAGTDGLFRVALVTVALAVGLFTADLLLPSRRSL